MKEFRNLESLVKELECELLKEEDQALLFVGKGDDGVKPIIPNNCQCNGNNCLCPNFNVNCQNCGGFNTNCSDCGGFNANCQLCGGFNICEAD